MGITPPTESAGLTRVSKATFKDLTKHFKELNIIHENDNLPEGDSTETIVIDNYELLNQPFSESEVQKTVAGLKGRKSPGEDLVLNEFIKLSANKLSMFYINMFNTVFKSREVLDDGTDCSHI